MNAPFPLNPTVGEFFGNWVWNGVRWVCTRPSGNRVITKVLTVSGPYIPSPGLMTAVVECWGGGGAGGGCANSPSALYIMAGGGGGTGGYARKTLAQALVAGGVNVTIGAGGVPVPGLAGGNGQATSFGALCVAYGGFGGVASDPAVSAGQGGNGALPGVGDFAPPGACGLTGRLTILAQASTIRDSGALGGWLIGGTSNVDADPGQQSHGAQAYPNTGAGGGGGIQNQVSPGAALPEGGGGGSGVCVITEYTFADADDACINPPVNVNARVAISREPWHGPGPCPPGWGGQQQMGFDGDE